jgi:uncharacterized protein YuzE
MKKRIKYTDEPIKAKPIKDFLPPPNKLRLRQRSAVRVVYDKSTDTLRLLLSDRPIAQSDEANHGVVLDYDQDGKIVGLEVLDASKLASNPKALEFAVTG